MLLQGVWVRLAAGHLIAPLSWNRTPASRLPASINSAHPGATIAIGVDVMMIRLTRKLADMIDGIDLSAYKVGQVITLPVAAARLLIAERWAEMIERRKRPRTPESGSLQTVS